MKRFLISSLALATLLIGASCSRLELPDDWRDQNKENVPSNPEFMAAVSKIDPSQDWNIAAQGTFWARKITVTDVASVADPDTKAGPGMTLAAKISDATIAAGKTADFFAIQNGTTVNLNYAQSDAMATITLGVYYYDEDGEMVKVLVYDKIKNGKVKDSKGKDVTPTAKNVNVGEGKAFGFYITVDWNNEINTYYSEGRLNDSEKGHVKLVTTYRTETYWEGLKKKTRQVVDKQYLAFEDDPLGDWDYNDIVFSVNTDIQEGNVPIIALERDGGPWMLLCEDLGGAADNDFNDIIFIVHRLTKTKMQIEYMASGATRPDDILFNNVVLGEIHKLFGLDIDWSKDYSTTSMLDRPKWFINTIYYDGKPGTGAATWSAPVKSAIIEVQEDQTMATFYRTDINNTSQGFAIRSNNMAEVKFDINYKGFAPFFICIPASGFKWPAESVKIWDAYPEFLGWARDHSTNTDWYLHPAPGAHVITPEIIEEGMEEQGGNQNTGGNNGGGGLIAW